MLELSGIDVYYGNVQTLWDIDLRVDSGEIVAIIGSNGAGKTTILNTVIGLLRPKRGEIKFGGEDISRMPAYGRIRKGITLIPEGRLIFSKMSVQENLLLGAYIRGSKNNFQDTLKWVYELFPILGERKNQVAETLSGGEQQMLAIARGLMSKPSLLVLDEPTLGLSPLMVKKIFDTVYKLNQGGITILISAQNVKQALDICDRGYVIESGRVSMEGGGKELLNDPGIKEAYLGI